MNDLDTELKRLWEKLCNIEFFCETTKQLLDVGFNIWFKGWAEGSSGNISLRLDAALCHIVLNYIADSKNITAHEKDKLSHFRQWYLVSVSGSRFRDYKIKGWQNFTFVGIYEDSYVNAQADYMTFPKENYPTSEWKVHASIHRVLLKQQSSKRVLLHVHDTDWMLLSTLPEFVASKAELIKDIYLLFPELKYYLKHGISLLPFSEPGSDELAILSEKEISHSDCIVWERHGVIVSADNIETAYDYLELMNKAAVIYLRRRKI